MKDFLLVAEDQLTGNQIVMGTVSNVRDIGDLIETYDLNVFHKGEDMRSLRDRDRKVYWDGKTSDALIYIYEIGDRKLVSRDDLQDRVHRLHCEFY